MTKKEKVKIVDIGGVSCFGSAIARISKLQSQLDEANKEIVFYATKIDYGKRARAYLEKYKQERGK